MNKECLLIKIKQEFKDVTLGNAYTLAEKDYYDTAHCHFDDMHVNQNMTRDEWVDQEVKDMPQHGWWLPEEIEEGIKAIKEKRKMLNRFLNPLDVSVEYLNRYRGGFMFLQPQAYLFYTPSIMIHKLCNPDSVDGFSFNSWLSILIFKTDELDSLLAFFSKKQFSILIDFLNYLRYFDTVDEFDKEDLEIVLKKVQSIKFS